MNPFSQLLSSYVNASNVNVSKMASYCEIDRSSMYKILQGTRKPGTLDLVVRISHYLNLSPEQTELLTEQYEILQIGHFFALPCNGRQIQVCRNHGFPVGAGGRQDLGRG